MAAFYLAIDKEVVCLNCKMFTGVELIHEHLPMIIECNAVAIEPFEAVDVYIREGFQQFVPPLMLPAGEIGAIHVRLTDDPRIKGISFGIFQLKFRVGEETINTPKFLWCQR